MSRTAPLRSFVKSTTVRVLKVLVGLLGRVSPALASRLLADRFLATHKRTPPSREVEWLEGAHRFDLSSEGVSCSVVSWGAVENPAILLMHGWEGRASQMGAFARPLVHAGYRVVAVDAPGHGEAPGESSSIFAMAQALRAAADAVGGVRAVVAHSGGSVASGFAVARGLRVDRLVFISAPYDPGRFLYEAAAEWNLSRGIAARTQRLLEKRLGIRWDAFDLGVLAPERREELMVVHDRGDRIVSMTDGESIAADWPRARLVPTEGLGHHRILRDPRVVDLVVQFVDSGTLRYETVA